MSLTEKKPTKSSSNLTNKVKNRKIDIDSIKQQVDHNIVKNLSKEDKEAFYGSPEYFQSFDENIKGKNKRALKKDVELELGRVLENYKRGSDENLEQVVIAYNKLFKYNQTKVYRQVWFFLKLNNIFFYDINHAFQDGLLELHKGILEYDTSYNTSLYTKVHFSVKKALSKGADSARDIPVSQAGGNKIYVINTIIDEYKRKNNVSPSSAYIIKEAKENFDIALVPNEIDTLLAIQKGFYSYDFTTQKTIESVTPVGCTPLQLSEVLDDEYSYKQLEEIETNAQLKDLLTCLSEREKLIVFHYFKIDNKYCNLTQRELAKELNTTVYKLKKELNKALDKLRKFATERKKI